MNAERLHRILKFVRDELDTSQEINHLQQLRNGLRAQISQPQDTNHSAVVANALKSLRSILPEVESNNISPSWQQLLQELGLYDLMGDRLLTQIESIVQRNNITPTIAFDEIDSLLSQLNNLKKGIDELLSGFQSFDIGEEELQLHECEVGILIPRKAVDNRLDKFRKELDDLDFILKHFSEITLGEQQPLEINTISTCDINLLLEYAPKAAAFLALAIERIVALYKNILEVKRLRQELEENDIPSQALESIDQHLNTKMETGIEEFVSEEFEKFCTVEDEGRKNELQNGLLISMNKIANRIDRGFNFEVRIGYDSVDENQDDENSIDDNVQIILKVQKSLEYIKTEGDPILRLPETKKKKKDTQE